MIVFSIENTDWSDGVYWVKTLDKDNEYVIGHDVNYHYRRNHGHDYYEFQLILSGNTVHCVNGKIQILNSGELICVRPGDMHFYTPYSDSSDRYEYYVISVSKEYMQKQFAYCEKLCENIIKPELPPIVRLSDKDFNALERKFKKMEKKDFDSERKFLHHLVIKEILWYMLDLGAENRQKKLPEWFENYLLNISRVEMFSLDYSRLVSKSNVSEGHLCKTFKKYFDMTTTEYINNLRLEYAYELILTSSKSMGEIAFEVGFNSYGYFFRKFTEKYGISPKLARKNTIV